MSYLEGLAIADRTSVALRAGLSDDPSDVSQLITQAEGVLAEGSVLFAQAHYFAAVELAASWADRSGTTRFIEERYKDDPLFIQEVVFRAFLEKRYPDIGLAFFGEHCTDYVRADPYITDRDRRERLETILEASLAVPVELQQRAERIATLTKLDPTLLGYR